MPDPFRLPRIKTLDRLVDALGRPTVQFVKFFNVDFAGAIERQEAAQATASAALAAVVADLAAAVADIQAAQAAADAAQSDIDNVVIPQAVAVASASQVAQSAANAAQTTADDALGGGTQSGWATDPDIDVLDDGVWVEGPRVDLTGVVAGNLTISGSGPQQDGDVELVVTPGTMTGEFRVVEIDGATETVLYTGSFRAYQSATGASAVITNLSSEAVGDFTTPLTTTGALGYRIDARRLTGPSLLSLSLYIYARRAA